MKKILFFAALVVAITVVATSCNQAPKAALKNDVDSMSYAVGVNFGVNFAQQVASIPGGEINKDDLIAGFISAFKGEDTKIAADSAQKIMMAYFEKVANKESVKAKEDGEKFLAENKAKDSVQVTESGLQYKVITEGTGATPTAESEVMVNYRGTLIDGTEFDKNDSITFVAGNVIKGWTEGLQLMKEGGKYQLVIPSELGYGEQGAGAQIKPHSVLVFEIELLKVLPAKK